MTLRDTEGAWVGSLVSLGALESQGNGFLCQDRIESPLMYPGCATEFWGHMEARVAC